MAKQILIVDSFVSTLCGIPLFCVPQLVGDTLMTKKTDGVHWHLIRCIGSQLIASGIFSWRFRNKDIETKSACFVLRLITGILCSFLFLHTKSQQAEIVQPQVLSIASTICVGSSLFFITLLVITGWRMGNTVYYNNKIGNVLYQLDTIAATSIGIAWIMDPKWLLHKQVLVQMDETHELCGRIMGIMFIASQVISAHALHWRSFRTRAIAAEARGMCCLLILFAQVWSQISYASDWSYNHWVGISLFSTWTVIALCYRIYIWINEANLMHPISNGVQKNQHETDSKLVNGSSLADAKKRY